MTDIARLPFQHADGAGTLLLSDDGTVRVEPSEALRDALAGIEERALAQARNFGTLPGLGLIGLGLAAVAAGWYAGRVYGKYAWRRTTPRTVHAVEITPDADGSLRVRLGSSLWVIKEDDPMGTHKFLTTLKEMKHEA